MENAEKPSGTALRSWEPLTAAEVAEILKVPRRQVRRLGIPVVQLSPRTLRWLREDVEAFVRRRRIGGDVEHGRRR